MRTLAAGLLLLAASCVNRPAMQESRRDVHSYARPEQVRVNSIELDLDVRFDREQIAGHAVLRFDRWDRHAPLILDTRGLRIEKVETATDDGPWTEGTFQLGAADPILGAPLEIPLSGPASRVRVHYATGPGASALQWLDPPQTAGKQPFLFTQSQAIHARSWIPLQDSPGIRCRYRATIRTPKNLLAVMSASSDPNAPRNGEYRFQMRWPVPSYLIALAVGDLEFRSLGAQTGVYAEKALIDRAAREFADTEKMLRATEEIYGRYRWGRYDLLVLPPSFPFGGMENPTLTFVTPTILAGDKSLVSLVAHELAHSWSGNLVSNATWRDFWLNEGFTVYVENRILERVYGKPRADMEAVLGRGKLAADLARLPAAEQILHIDLKGRDPDDGATDVPYEKGALFLRHLEQAVGRPRFDEFLKKYFQHFAFTSITTGVFRGYLEKHLPEAASNVPVEEWLTAPGLPKSAPEPKSEAFARIDAGAMPDPSWSTQEWLHFIGRLPPRLTPDRMRELDRQYRFLDSGNDEILCEWLVLSVRHRYEEAYARLEEFLVRVGRRRYLKPLYEELAKTPGGKARAQAIYRKARPGYHPIAVSTVDGIVK